jgi:hypothetical protein
VNNVTKLDNPAAREPARKKLRNSSRPRSHRAGDQHESSSQERCDRGSSGRKTLASYPPSRTRFRSQQNPQNKIFNLGLNERAAHEQICANFKRNSEFLRQLQDCSTETVPRYDGTDPRRLALPLTGSILRIALVAVLVSTVAAQTNPSAQRKSDSATRSAARPAEVTYANGQLSVLANNNSLAETLAEIRNLTKAKIEGVQPGAAERVSGEFGPDTPRAVVGALLASSHYNFILVSPPGNPAVLQRIVLSEPAPEPVAAVQPAPQPPMQMVTTPQASAQAAPPTQPGRLEEPSADVPFAKGEQPNATAKDEPQQPEAGVAEQRKPDVTSGTGEVKQDEAKPDTDMAAGTSEPNQPTHESQPTVPATVVICGVTYDASQLADLKVPDHCGKPAQQPNASNGSK